MFPLLSPSPGRLTPLLLPHLTTPLAQLYWVLVKYVPTFSPGLNSSRTHCYDTRQCTAAMPLVVKLLLLGEGIVGKVNKRKRADRYRKTDCRSDSCCCWCGLLGCLTHCH